MSSNIRVDEVIADIGSTMSNSIFTHPGIDFGSIMSNSTFTHPGIELPIHSDSIDLSYMIGADNSNPDPDIPIYIPYTVSAEYSYGDLAFSGSNALPDAQEHMSNANLDYFKTLLFERLQKLIHIDTYQDRSEFEELKIYIRSSLTNFFESYMDRKRIESFNINKIYSEDDIIVVVFSVIRQEQLHQLSIEYDYTSTNYGFK